VAPRSHSWSRLESDLHFADLARDFIGVASSDLPEAVGAGIERTRTWTDADFAVLAVTDAWRGTIWIQLDGEDDFAPLIDRLTEIARAGSDVLGGLLSGDDVVVRALDALPVEAAREREALADAGIGSIVLMPVIDEAGSRIGCFIIGTRGRPFDWDPEAVGRLRILADSYATLFQRQQIDLQRQRTELRFQTLLEVSNDIVCEFDEEGALIFVSSSADDVLGVSPDDLIGRGFLDIVHPDDRALAAQALHLDPGLPFEHVVVRLRDSEGRYRWMEAEGSSFPGMPGPRRVLALLRDISHRYEHQAELEENLAIEREVTELAREFVGLESASLAEAFKSALEKSAGIADCDEAYVVAMMPDLNVGGGDSHTWTRPGCEPVRSLDPSSVSQFRDHHFGRLLRRGEPIIVPNIELLPEEAAAERRSLEERGVGSYLGLPLIEGGRTVGMIRFVTIGRTTEWSDHKLNMLRLVAELFGAVFRRARGEAHIREREERFRVLADHSPDPIIEMTPSGRILFASQTFARLLGDEDDDWVGRHVTDFVSPLEIGRLMEIRDDGVLGRRMAPAVFQCTHKDGSLRHLEATMRTFRTASGERHAIGVIRDVTARLESERTLEQQLVLERQIAQISRDFLTHDFDRFDEDVRRNAALLADLARADHCAVVSLGTGPGGDVEMFEWFNEELDASRRAPLMIDAQEYPSTTKALFRGERVHLEGLSSLPKSAVEERASFEQIGVRSFLAIPFMHERRLKGMFVLSALVEEAHWTDQDMTILTLANDIIHNALQRRHAARELEQSQLQLVQSQKMEAVGTLAGGIAHDFNNQLAVMLGNARFVLAQTREGDEQREALLDLERAAEHCASLTRSLLAFSRQTTEEPTTLDVEDWLGDVSELVKPLLPSTISLSLEIDGDVGAVRGDATQLQQVMVNLLVNARDAMPRGGRIRVHAQPTLLSEERRQLLEVERADVLEITVADDGVGMDEAVRDRIFEPFFTTKALGQGTGLGLATVYGIVKQCGGHIEVESEPGAGSTFRVLLPSQSPQTKASAQPGAPVAESTRSFDTVLLVEDEPAVRRVVRRMLDTRAKLVIEAHDGNQALEIIEDRLDEIDLIVTDMVMPRMGGLALARVVAETRPDLPTLFLSGYPDDALDFEREPVKHRRFLQKPFTQRDLMQALESLLESVG